jgi:hypothetical protein
MRETMPANDHPRVFIMAGAAVAVLVLAVWWLQRAPGGVPTPPAVPAQTNKPSSRASETAEQTAVPAPSDSAPADKPGNAPRVAGNEPAPSPAHPTPAPSPLPPVIERNPAAEGETGERIPPITRSHSLAPELERVHQDLAASARLLAGLAR